MEWINRSYSLERRSDVELAICVFIQDLGKWCGYPKDQPHYQTYGESFDELQLKLHKLLRGLSQATPSSPCSNKALLCWYWQRQISRSPY